MNRILITAVVIGFIAGCAGPAATQSPTANPTTPPTTNASTEPTVSPTADATASPTSAPTASPATTAQDVVELPGGDLDPGTYTGVYEGTRFTFAVPDSGWSSYIDTGCCVLYEGDDEETAQMFLGGDITSLYADACETAGTEFDPGPSVDDLAAALASLEGFESTEPTDVTLNGYEGKRVALTVPADVDVRNPDCAGGQYSLWSNRWYQASGQTDDLWILDVDGKRHVLTFSTTPNTPADVVDQLEQIRDSIVIERVAPTASASAAAAPTTVPPSGAQPLLIDTDVAPDDLAAIAFLLASPNVDIRAITVSGTGEAHCEGGVETVHGLLERLGAPAIDVACGRETPIAGDHAFPDEWRAAVDDGSGLELPSHSRQPFAGTAVELIEKTAQDFDGLRVLTIGPLTNLAEALDSNPDLAERLESVYAMGGALFVPGNVRFGGPPDNEVAEWNIYVDPTSAQMVIDSGVPVRLISLDGTSQVPVTPEYADRVAQESTGPGAQVLAELFAEHPFMTDGSYYLWDPLAAALAADYAVGSFSPARVDVEEAEGSEVGFTRPIDGAPNVEYLSSADQAAAEDALLETLN